MRVPSDVPPPFPPRIESPTPLTDAVGGDAPGWQEAADALDAMTPSAADDNDSAQDQEQQEGGRRHGLQWPDPEEEDSAPALDPEAARRPELGNGFWVLPDPRTPLPRVHAQSRSPLIAEPSRPLSTDLPGQRHARQGRNDSDDDTRREKDAGQDEGRAKE
jgi:hypothetical protein